MSRTGHNVHFLMYQFQCAVNFSCFLAFLCPPLMDLLAGLCKLGCMFLSVFYVSSSISMQRPSRCSIIQTKKLEIPACVTFRSVIVALYAHAVPRTFRSAQITSLGSRLSEGRICSTLSAV